MLGLSLPDLLRSRSMNAAAASHMADVGSALAGNFFGKAKSCIVVFLFGAPAHQDTWDMKPDAPSEMRGEFKPISTSVPGIVVCEHLPRLAQIANRLAIVRSVTHPDNTHTVAMHYMLTGTRHVAPSTNPRNGPGDFPTYGAVMNYVRPAATAIPCSVSLNAPANQVSAGNFIFPGFFAGFLGSAHDPLFIAQDPNSPDFQGFPESGETDRLPARRSLIAEVNEQSAWLEQAPAVRNFDQFHERAINLVAASTARKACELDREAPQARDRYGRNSFGQACLLARRLIEAGVSLVTVNWARDDAYWDTHKDNFQDLKDKLLPPFDLGFSALIEDLEQRGLLDETLVVCLGEFGRTPKINAAAGRDHWASCFSVLFAGGGIRGGQVYGMSDRLAAYPTDGAVTPSVLAATIFSALGVDPHLEIRDRVGRPYRISTGEPLAQLF
jgi:hypothetical protein